MSAFFLSLEEPVFPSLRLAVTASIPRALQSVAFLLCSHEIQVPLLRGSYRNPSAGDQACLQDHHQRRPPERCVLCPQGPDATLPPFREVPRFAWLWRQTGYKCGLENKAAAYAALPGDICEQSAACQLGWFLDPSLFEISTCQSHHPSNE